MLWTAGVTNIMREIMLTKRQVAQVSDRDYTWLNQWSWYARHGTNTWYAQRTVSQRPTVTVQMHRLILGVIDPKIEVDHRDNNGLNNMRSNLRTATHNQNQHNQSAYRSSSSPYVGVGWNVRHSKWQVQISINGRNQWLGYFTNETEAAHAYDRAAIELHGKFARVNFP
jgi:hypothetical protein